MHSVLIHLYFDTVFIKQVLSHHFVLLPALKSINYYTCITADMW